MGHQDRHLHRVVPNRLLLLAVSRACVAFSGDLKAPSLLSTILVSSIYINLDAVPTQSSLESNIKQAIAACKEEHGNVLQNRKNMQTVRETLDEGYCDISGRVNDIINIGESITFYSLLPEFLSCNRCY